MAAMGAAARGLGQTMLLGSQGGRELLHTVLKNDSAERMQRVGIAGDVLKNRELAQQTKALEKFRSKKLLQQKQFDQIGAESLEGAKAMHAQNKMKTEMGYLQDLSDKAAPGTTVQVGSHKVTTPANKMAPTEVRSVEVAKHVRTMNRKNVSPATVENSFAKLVHLHGGDVKATRAAIKTHVAYLAKNTPRIAD
jgi:hypothetical protein